MDFLLSPPVAFLIYIPLVLAIAGLGQRLAGPGTPSEIKESPYTGGEEPTADRGVPGYRPFFLIALFFAVLHLGTLVLGTGDFTPRILPYLFGLLLALVVLMLG